MIKFILAFVSMAVVLGVVASLSIGDNMAKAMESTVAAPLVPLADCICHLKQKKDSDGDIILCKDPHNEAIRQTLWQGYENGGNGPLTTCAYINISADPPTPKDGKCYNSKYCPSPEEPCRITIVGKLVYDKSCSEQPNSTPVWSVYYLDWGCRGTLPMVAVSSGNKTETKSCPLVIPCEECADTFFAMHLGAPTGTQAIMFQDPYECEDCSYGSTH